MSGHSGRLRFERVCRAVGVVALLGALVQSWRAARPRGAMVPQRVAVRVPDAWWQDSSTRALALVRDALVRDALVREALVTDASVTESAARPGAPRRNGADDRAAVREPAGRDTLLLPLFTVPPTPLRAALASVRAAGVPLGWIDSTPSRGFAASVSRAMVPGGPLNVRVATAGAAPVTLRDAGGTLDSVAAARGVITWRLRSAVTPLRVRQGAQEIALAVPDSGAPRRLLLLAEPGWEGKFAVAALEEAGWAVDGSWQVSPTGRVTIGAPQRLDTARYAAVIVADSTAVNASALAQYVARGGGLVLSGDALRIPALAALRPARATIRRGAIAGGLLTATPRRGLEAWELEPTPDALVLETERSDHGHDEPALVARRVGGGRVVATPFRETWRWRMQGTDDGAAAHRAWWHGAVAAAVPGVRGTMPVAAERFPGAGAPYADLVARVGAPVDGGGPGGAASGGDGRRANGDIPPRRQPWVLLLTALAALLGEWGSRRLRGAR